TAAACRFTPRTADHSSKACPRDLQTKHWYRPKRTLTENERLRECFEPCTGQGPRHWSPRCTAASNCNCSRTARIGICSRSNEKFTPGMPPPPLRPTEKRNRYLNPHTPTRWPTDPTTWVFHRAANSSSSDRRPPSASPRRLFRVANLRLCAASAT